MLNSHSGALKQKQCPFTKQLKPHSRRVEAMLKISQKNKALGKSSREAHQLKYVASEWHYYLGKKYRLKVKLGEQNKVELKKTIMLVTCRNRISAKTTKKILHDWYLEKAKVLFEKMLDECWKKFPYRKHKKPGLRIRHMKTCWATISLASHKITLNTDLMQVPRACIRYIIFHELCHLKTLYHDDEFYALLRKVEPNLQKRRAQLDRFGI